MRKDVECTFGILKGRWRILKSGIRLHGLDVVDTIWRTCFALHNMLLEVDGLSEEWDGHIGLFEKEDDNILPFALRRLSSPNEIRNYDCSGMGPGTDIILDHEEYDDSFPITTIPGHDMRDGNSPVSMEGEVLLNDLSMDMF
jgi:hypothetical protein